LVEAGSFDRARALAASLASELQAEPQAYAKIIEGDVALKNGDPRQAIKLLSEAPTRSWTRGSAISISGGHFWRPAPSRRRIPSSTAA
jgi:outer membrane PBP1 activator LpoA protein